MPNQGNKSNGKSGIVQPKRRATKASTQHPDNEPSELKGGEQSKEKKGSSGKSSNQEGKSE